MPTNVHDCSIPLKTIMAEYDTWQAVAGNALVVPVQHTTAATVAQNSQWNSTQAQANPSPAPSSWGSVSFAGDDQAVSLDDLLGSLARRLKVRVDTPTEGQDWHISSNSLALLVKILDEIVKRTNIALPTENEMSFMDAIEDVRG